MGHVYHGIHETTGAVAAGQAVRIFTGAQMVSGPDTVIMQEDCRPDGDAVVIRPGIKRGANIRSAGEDIGAGSVILRQNRRLRPQDVGLAASVGRARLAVYKPLKVAVFSTGDELYDPGWELPAGGIYDSNRYTLMALLEGLGCAVDDLGILQDRFESIRDALDGAATNHDLIVTSGGMSVGEEDHVKTAVETLGSLHFWRLAIKPGRPIGLGCGPTFPTRRRPAGGNGSAPDWSPTATAGWWPPSFPARAPAFSRPWSTPTVWWNCPRTWTGWRRERSWTFCRSVN